jgi:hypothetical protein
MKRGGELGFFLLGRPATSERSPWPHLGRWRNVLSPIFLLSTIAPLLLSYAFILSGAAPLKEAKEKEKDF